MTFVSYFICSLYYVHEFQILIYEIFYKINKLFDFFITVFQYKKKKKKTKQNKTKKTKEGFECDKKFKGGYHRQSKKAKLVDYLGGKIVWGDTIDA